MNQLVCIIGAGAAGIAAAKTLKKAGIDFIVKEKELDAGGIWDENRMFSPMYKNLHLISPNSLMMYEDDPFPEYTPDFASYRYIKSYFHKVIDKYQMHDNFEYGCHVVNVEYRSSAWFVHDSHGNISQHKYLIIASGMQSRAKMLEIVHDNSILIIHSVDYRSPSQLLDKRVLVIGGGQTSIDVAKDGVIAAHSVIHSMRQKPNWFPKYSNGFKPSELLYFKTPAPVWVKRIIMNQMAAKIHNLPVFSKLPKRERVMNAIIDQNHLEHYVRRDIIVKPGIERISEKTVYFYDGTKAEVDLIVAATGYYTEFPFIDRQYLRMLGSDRYPNFFAHTLHPIDPSIFTCGILHPVGGHWPTYELQSKLIEKSIALTERKQWATLELLKSTPEPNYNRLEMYLSQSDYPVIEKITYHRFLKSLLAKFDMNQKQVTLREPMLEKKQPPVKKI